MKIKFYNPFRKKRYEIVFRPELVRKAEKKEEQQGIATMTVKDTYTAAYYISMGAELESVRQVDLAPKRAGRKGYKKQWIMTISNIPLQAIALHQSGKSAGSIDNLAGCRRRLKREIKRHLGIKRCKSG